ncbi:hypothetical protein BZG36_02651 [Bifiguratus adelaidae]|uniref:Fucosyltransferase n=1 Tax=Bifiguratus adelaidae TaxID=1938954 RepID=A0A261Y359_9FUNG|nr:hypothetical protein BZG36_02651 [Bifiguratus adelaidae]
MRLWNVSEPIVRLRIVRDHPPIADVGDPGREIVIHRYPSSSTNLSAVPCSAPYRYTNDINEADVVIWSNTVPGIIAKYKFYPSKADQLHALFALESFANYRPNAAFDYYMTYELDSDVPLAYAYDFMDLKAPAIPFAEKRSDALAAAFITNCDAKNNRLQVLKELMRYIPIHSYGKCLNNMPLDRSKGIDRWAQKASIIRQYKFSIAFENSNSQDYVTEKYFQALEAGSVPIFLGTDTFRSSFMPHPYSAIVVEEFDSIRQLADYLVWLDEHPSEYEKYLEWKELDYTPYFGSLLDIGRSDAVCRLVRFLKNNYTNTFVREYVHIPPLLSVNAEQ